MTPTTESKQVQFTGKCTACRKTFTVSDEQLREAHDIGCVFSACCSAVATIERVQVNRRVRLSSRKR